MYAKHSLTAEPLWYLFSVQNFRCLFENATDHFGFLLGHFWYISLDVWLFLIWVVILRYVPKKHLKTAFTISLLVGILWRTLFIIYVPENISIAYMIPIGMMDSWALGGLVALNVEEKGANSKLMWSEIIVGLLGVVMLTAYNAYLHGCSFEESYQLYRTASGYMQNPLTGQTYFFVALFFVGLLRYCTDAKIKHPILSATPLVALGGMTYELYCFHYPVRYAAKHFLASFATGASAGANHPSAVAVPRGVRKEPHPLRVPSTPGCPFLITRVPWTMPALGCESMNANIAVNGSS